MSLGPINKVIPNNQWELHKGTIKSMYLDANLKLQGSDDLMAYMARVHSFSPSKAQYERQLRKWGFFKNRGQNDWKVLSHKISKRKKVGKDSEIYMNNKLLSKEKVHRQTTRYGTIATDFQATSPRTPEQFTIRTPEAEAPRLPLPNWAANLPFFRLEANITLIPELNIASMPVRNVELQGFIDPRMLHTPNNNTPEPILESQSMAGDLLPSLFSRNLGQTTYDFDDNIPNPEQLVAILKSWLPKSALESLLAIQSNSVTPGERLKSILSKIMVFSTANSFMQFHNLPTNMVQCLDFSMSPGILKRLQHAGRLEMEALAENLFLAAIEAENASLVKFLLLKTSLDCNKLVCFVDGRRYTPVERSSQLRSIRVTQHLIDSGADVNKTFGEFHHCGALSLALYERKCRSCVDPSLVRMLLLAGAKVEPYMLSFVIEQANLSLVGLLLNSLDETNRAAWDGIFESAILYLDHQSALSIITRIVQAGAYPVDDISLRGGEGLTGALNKAAEFGSVEQVQYLLSVGAQGTIETLSLAISGRKIETVQFLLSSDISPTELDLDTAVSSGERELVQIILSCNVRPTQETLHLAIRSGNKEVVELIVDSGADPDGLHISGTTPLAVAILSKDERIVQFLGAKGAWSNISEKTRFAAALEAALEVEEIEIVRHLLSTQENLETVDLSGPLLTAMRRKQIEIAEMLLDADNGNSISKRHRGKLLTQAIGTGSRSLVRLVLNYSSGNVSQWDGSWGHLSLLEAAVRQGDQKIIQDLLDSGVYINPTALSLAVNNRDVKVVQILLDAGVNVNAYSAENHKTALCNALENCDIEMAEVLLSNGANPDHPNVLFAAMLYCRPLLRTLLEELKKDALARKALALRHFVLRS